VVDQQNYEYRKSKAAKAYALYTRATTDGEREAARLAMLRLGFRPRTPADDEADRAKQAEQQPFQFFRTGERVPRARFHGEQYAPTFEALGFVATRTWLGFDAIRELTTFTAQAMEKPVPTNRTLEKRIARCVTAGIIAEQRNGMVQMWRLKA
jgi:hypothetical protein